MSNQRGFCVPNVNLPRPLLFGLVGDAVSRHELVKHHDSDEHVHLRHTEESLVRFYQPGGLAHAALSGCFSSLGVSR